MGDRQHEYLSVLQYIRREGKGEFLFLCFGEGGNPHTHIDPVFLFRHCGDRNSVAFLYGSGLSENEPDYEIDRHADLHSGGGRDFCHCLSVVPGKGAEGLDQLPHLLWGMYGFERICIGEKRKRGQ